jgi:hypothetical protein
VQFDVLWPELTGREHLRLWGAIKGLPRSEWDAQADAMLKRVGMEHTVNMFTCDTLYTVLIAMRFPNIASRRGRVGRAGRRPAQAGGADGLIQPSDDPY